MRNFASLLALLLCVPAFAQGRYPEKPIRIVVPSSAGGTQDALARLLAPRLTESFKQPVIIENRPGAGGMMGASIVAKAEPDGYTLLLASGGFAANAALRSSDLPYNPAKDFSGVATIGYSTTVLVVSPQSGFKSVKELIAAGHAQPGKILYGSSGAGSATHMNAERFRLAAGFKGAHVGFKGQPEFLLAIAAGRIHFGVGGLGPSLTFIKNGQLVPLAVSTPQRSTLLPDVPTSAEVLPAWGRDGTHGVLVPSRTPRAIVNQLNREIGRVLDLPDVRERLQTIDYHVVKSTPEEFDRLLRADIQTFSKVAKAAGLIAK